MKSFWIAGVHYTEFQTGRGRPHYLVGHAETPRGDGGIVFESGSWMDALEFARAHDSNDAEKLYEIANSSRAAQGEK
jgi:hypothetical protein